MAPTARSQKGRLDYFATAANFAAEFSTGTNMNGCTTDDFTKSADASVYYIDPEYEDMKNLSRDDHLI